MNEFAPIGGLDVAAIRAQFPILKETVHGKPLVFLDTAASAQRPSSVINAEVELYEKYYANIHRGVYKFSQDATTAYEKTRESVRAFIGAKHKRECIFVRGATEGINLVAQTWGRANLKEGDEILLTYLEHHSNIVPWQLVAEEKGATVKAVPVLEDGSLDMDAYRSMLNERTKMVAFTHVSNSIGTQTDAKEIIRLAHDAGALTLIDGCQAAPHLKIDVQDLDADFYAFSAHKMYGPTGIGVIYGKEALLDAMPPWQGGGDMISTVTFEKTTFNDLPHKFEAGTPNIAGGIGFDHAIEFMNEIGVERIAAHEADLLKYATEQLSAMNSVRLIGTAPKKGALISFVMEHAHPHDIGTILDQQGIAVRAGHHCAQPIMDNFSIPGTVRASFGVYNDRSDVDALVVGLKKVMDIFG
ncbi:cysteine desulfurase [Kordiimonas sp. SCSIO 12603]|uniref:cysteine desulfurase n=1 Tax=Kordiimonas sp. SCSIO 12603 TaxID=2829596 RepID=UPI0021052CAF|nr:cysteine desulfurase [Kordiimonas sp. SCSIO 12603]UTW58889.1 cysteine desulfurase [Kordiimonas sp. SCSIO 12603]